jgi:hypothetical protein
MDKDMDRKLEFLSAGWGLGPGWGCSNKDCTWKLPDVPSAAIIFSRHVCDEGGHFDADEEVDKYERVPK